MVNMIVTVTKVAEPLRDQLFEQIDQSGIIAAAVKRLAPIGAPGHQLIVENEALFDNIAIHIRLSPRKQGDVVGDGDGGGEVVVPFGH